MNAHPLNSFLRGSQPGNTGDHRRKLRELIQKICLLGLWRGTFFEHAAFYGGTALRMLYGLDRWSEDLDFSLLEEKPDFRLGDWLNPVRQELEAWGIKAEVDLYEKKASQSESAFIKANTLKILIDLKIPSSELSRLHRDEVSSVCFELDPHPPCGFESESRFLLEPIPFSVRVMSLPDLFAGKMHAVLARGWASRVKGRDWYDLIWFVRSGATLNLDHLEARLKQSGHLEQERSLDAVSFRALLRARIGRIDFAQAKQDVLPFITDPAALQNWSKELFQDLLTIITLQ
ncbi:MAG: nucleotidyl transferase AbiEii/AbiGii toxin family protein [Candidatus Cloacimonetes bacterium]|nr:nucleotidyl transferase AbiEii/AbiGii toxin family protein [Candidatus Cloacimonadota bacterium]